MNWLKSLPGFAIISALIVIGLLSLNSLIGRLPESAQNVLGFASLILSLWVVFDLIVKIIYTLSGVTQRLGQKHPKKLDHQQSERVARYWNVWLVSALTTGVVYTLVFDRQHWKSSAILGLLFAVGIVASFINRRQSIMGYTKKELFK